MNKLLFLLLFAGLVSWQAAVGQWTSDPFENTRFTDLSGEQVIPKIAVCSDGYAYIAWYSNHLGNYNMYLQRIDKDGNPQWQPNGILISDNVQDSWLTDWDMTVDADNHAILVFPDIRSGVLNPYSYRVSPAGAMMWGEDGVTLSGSPNFEPSPKVCATLAGNSVFAWQSEGATSEVHLQKVSPDGIKQWGDGIVLVSATVNLASPFLEPADGDNVYLIWHEQSGPFWAPNRGIYVQKLDANGNFLWPAASEVCAPVASGVVVSTKMCRSSEGGIFFTWYRNDVGLHFHTYVQYMDAAGNIQMPAGGALASTSTNRNHMYPSPAYLDATNEVVIYFSEQDLDQAMRGLYAQKLDVNGNRQWGDEGSMLIPLSNNDYSLPAASGLHENSICIYEAGSSVSATVQAVMLDGNGNFAWNQQFVDMSTYGSEKIHREITPYYFGQWVAVWEDGRNGGRNIYAQNIQPNASLGIVVTGIENNQSGNAERMVTASPNPFSDELNFTFRNIGKGPVQIEIYDATGSVVVTYCYETQKDDTGVFRVDTQYLSPGMYFYRIQLNDKTISGKLIK